MSFTVDRGELADAVAWTARHIPTRPSTPVLAGMLLEVTENRWLKLSGFDYGVSAEAKLPLHVAEPGMCLVSGRLLADITRALPDHPVTFTLDGAKTVVTCGSTRFALRTMPVEDYPALPRLPQHIGRADGEVFATAIAQVVAAAARDYTLPMLTGVRMEIEDKVITLAATDRYRLAVREFTWEPAVPGIHAGATIPARALADVARHLATGRGVEVFLDPYADTPSLVGFSSGRRLSTIRLIADDFPRFRSLLPTEFSARADVATSAFAEAIKRVALVAERDTPVRLTFRAGEVVLEAGSGDEAQAVEVLPVDFEGDEFTIAFNHQYLLDGLAVLDSDVARLQFTAPTKPAVITGQTGGDAADYQHLIMPIRLSS
ncbi:DNA polymerase III subunit beta [Thermobispora bispora]|uniref:DNA polymerase III subunit beta n=1 Tax=Thermobispora bispora TaxID=2006 RepID=UPI001981E735|nr:DNA polymerase III subunit beta [Thermobispora bispora]QSI49981.1 DNA polymerase III subunit beta [Thermobispora bispora]